MSRDDLAEAFEVERWRLVARARRLLGSTVDAEDAVQDAWLRLERHGASGIDNLASWLSTVVGRICLDQLRARGSLATIPWDDAPVKADDAYGPGDEAELAESVGLALLVVLDTLSPAEQLTLVLHDVFGLPFDEIAGILGKSRDATKMTASRARRKVRSANVPSNGGRVHRQVVDAFLAAARDGDLAGLVAVLDPEVVLRSDTPGGPMVVVGAAAVAKRAAMFASRSAWTRRVLVDGLCGIVSRVADGSPMSLMVFAVEDGRIVRILALADPARLVALNLPA